MDTTGLFELVEKRRFRELERRLDAIEEDIDGKEQLEVLRLRSALAAEGRGPLSDVVVAARELCRAGHSDAPAVVALAVRLLGSCGATAMARGLLELGMEGWPDRGELAFAKGQLNGSRFEGSNSAQVEVIEQLERGEFALAKRSLEKMVDQDNLLWAAQHLADLQRGTLDFWGAAETFGRCARAFPEADEVLSLRLAAALCRASEEELRKLREETADGTDIALWVHQCCTAVLESIDRDPIDNAIHIIKPVECVPRRGEPGQGIVKYVCDHLGLDIHTHQALPTLPHVNQALRSADVTTIRVLLDEVSLVAALCAEMIVLEEERPTETGFVSIEGFAKTTGLLFVRDPSRPGPFLRHIDEQWDRCALFGRSALVICGVGEEGRARLASLAENGVVHDERLDVVDRCDIDEEGRVPQQARIAALAEEALEQAPELPLPRKRLGEALLEQMRLGAISPNRAELYDHWFAETRYRFPEAEWPHQIHAQALELQDRIEEAGVAWSDAAACDPFDYRNFSGRAKSRAMLGDFEGAQSDLRRALSLEPSSASALCQAADLALARDDLDAALLSAEIALEIAPEDSAVLLMAATTYERRDEFDHAIELLGRAVELSERPTVATLRLVRRFVHDGDWASAEKSSERYCAMAQGLPGAWSTASWTSWSQAEVDGALSAAITGLQRCGPDRDLIEMAVASAGMLLEPSDISEALRPALDTLEATPQAFLEVASELARLRLWEIAAEVGYSAIRLMPEGPNPTWRTAQILLGEEASRVSRHDDIVELLKRTIERAQGYPHPRVLLGWLTGDDDPEAALELVEGADVQVAPALVWSLMEHLFEVLGRDNDASRVRARMPELYPVGVIEPASFLNACGFVDLSKRLLERAYEMVPEHSGLTIELALTLNRAGDSRRALDLLMKVLEKEPGRVPPNVMVMVATEASDWETVERFAAEAVEAGRRESGRGFVDPWPDKARLAGARLARGDESARTNLLDTAGRHPDALSYLHSIERLIDHPLAPETGRHIASVAPGVLHILERGGLR